MFKCEDLSVFLYLAEKVFVIIAFEKKENWKRGRNPPKAIVTPILVIGLENCNLWVKK